MDRPRRLLPLLLAACLLPLGCVSQSLHPDAAPYNGPSSPAAESAPAEAPVAGVLDQQPGRAVVHRASVALEVAEPEPARARIESEVAAWGGFVQHSEPGRVVVCVPTGRLRAALAELAKIGRVLGQRVAADDVTAGRDEADLQLQKLRQELATLEAQLAAERDKFQRDRLNEQLAATRAALARLEGERRDQSRRTALVPVEVRLQQDPAVEGLQGSVPVAWLRALPQVLGESRSVDLARRATASDWKHVDIDLPPGFVTFRKADYLTEAVDANATHVRVSRHDNLRVADPAFWQAAARRSLGATANLRIVGEQELKIHGGHPAHLFKCERTLGSRTLGYQLALAVSKGRVYTFEAWGLSGDLAGVQAALEKSIATLRFGKAEID